MQAIIINYLKSYLMKYGGRLLQDLWNHFWRSQEQRQALDKVEKVAADPKSSAQDVGEAYASAINSSK